MSIWLGNKKLAGSIVKYSHNIGDIFYTSRTDTILAGAVECNGATYQITDYTGNESIGALLASGKVPYISLSQYASDLAAHGSVRAFGWDGGNSTSFRVPTLSNVFLEAGQAASAGEYISAGLPNITGDVGTSTGIGHVANVSFGVSVKDSSTSGAFFPNLGCGYTATKQVQQGSDGKSLGFDASRSSSIYGNSSTVQPNSVKYRAMVQLANGATDEALMTCENVESDVESLKATLNNKITNCITEIPQDIKFELNNGTLTLKAGSKVYVPNGAGVFDEVVRSSDLVYNLGSPADGKYMIFNSQYFYSLSNCVSGSSDSKAGQTYHSWYDTTNNLVKQYWADGSAPEITDSLPVAIITISGGVITSIDQVFNGFGYIGSTVFALPGVKGLAPNGRNPDGSLKNNIVSVSSVITGLIGNYDAYVLLRNTSLSFYGDTVTFYRENENRLYDSYAGNYVPNNRFIIGHIKQSSSKITAFTPKTPFHAVDYSDTEYIAHQAMPSDRYTELTIGAPETNYTAPADGWFSFDARIDSVGYGVGLIYGANNDGHFESRSNCSAANQVCGVVIPVNKGQIITISYTTLATTNPRANLRFYYAKGAQ